MENCYFCFEFSLSIPGQLSFFQNCFPGIDRVLLETDHFVVVPTVGQIVEGYLIIVTKKHYLSMGHLPPSMYAELRWVSDQTSRVLQGVYGIDCIQFEHGPVGPSQSGGSCVNHAHLHVVPIDLDASVDIIPHLALMETVEIDEYPASAQRMLTRNKSYLYIKPSEGNTNGAILVDATGLPSQYMRRIIAKIVGKPDEWDWAVFVGERELLACLEKLRPLFAQLKNPFSTVEENRNAD